MAASALSPTDSDDPPKWYCIHTKSKCEHIAAAHLQRLTDEIQLFSPRLRYQKRTVRGKVWFTEALFPGYIFGQFVLEDWLRAVNHTPAVLRVISFGEHHPSIPDDIIALWRSRVEDDAVITVQEKLEPGDEIEVVNGPLRGIKTIITKVIPAKERVNILLEMLGNEREVELAVDAIRRADRDIRASTSGEFVS